MWLRLQKHSLWVHKIWLLFQIFMTHNVFYKWAMAIKFPTIIKNLMFQYWEMTFVPICMFVRRKCHNLSANSVSIIAYLSSKAALPIITYLQFSVITMWPGLQKQGMHVISVHMQHIIMNQILKMADCM